MSPTGVKRTADFPPGDFMASEERSLSAIQLQRETIREALECAGRRPARFIYLHDFLVTDLSTGRSEARRRMLEARREEAGSGGGTFVDLQQEFGREPGVAWFADLVHPSDVGHRRVGRLMCDLVVRTRPPNGEIQKAGLLRDGRGSD